MFHFLTRFGKIKEINRREREKNMIVYGEITIERDRPLRPLCPLKIDDEGAFFFCRHPRGGSPAADCGAAALFKIAELSRTF
jgi:hypothetical protein